MSRFVSPVKARWRRMRTPDRWAGVPDRPTEGRVVVVGAGLAGLTAAYELALRGWDVVALEAQEHPGGRVLTRRDDAAPRSVAELGAARIPTCHNLTLQYIDEFSLPVARYYPRRGAYVNLVRGQRYVAPAGCPPDPGHVGATLDAQESAMWRRETRSYDDDAMAEVGDVFDPQWPDAAVRALDEISEYDYWTRAGASDEWIRLHDFATSDEASQGQVSALFALRTKALLAKAPQGCRFLRLVGGMDRLPRAFADRLGARIRYDAAVDAIEQDGSGVRVHVQGAGGPIEGDRVVVAVPLGCLARIAIAPELPDDHARAIRDISGGAACKVVFAARSAYWRDVGATGYVNADLPAVVDPGAPVRGSTRSLLTVYFKTAAWPKLAGLTRDQRMAAAAELIDQAFPGAADGLENGVVQAWAEDPWARGSYAIAAPGQMPAVLNVLPRNEGRIHFAGDQTSPWTYWMQGAIQSGHRVVDEIARATTEPRR